jgi:hypothetical protein
VSFRNKTYLVFFVLLTAGVASIFLKPGLAFILLPFALVALLIAVSRVSDNSYRWVSVDIGVGDGGRSGFDRGPFTLTERGRGPSCFRARHHNYMD